MSHRHLAVLPSRLGASVERASVERGGAPGSGEEPDGELLQVGELARATGKTVRAIHLYEGLGLLRPATRSEGRYRLFHGDAVVRVRWIAKLQSLGLSLGEIQEVARAHDAEGSAQRGAQRLLETYRQKLSETRAKLAELHALEAELEASLHFLESCDTTCQPALTPTSCPTCDRHAAPAPELVAGARAH